MFLPNHAMINSPGIHGLSMWGWHYLGIQHLTLHISQNIGFEKGRMLVQSHSGRSRDHWITISNSSDRRTGANPFISSDEIALASSRTDVTQRKRLDSICRPLVGLTIFRRCFMIFMQRRMRSSLPIVWSACGQWSHWRPPPPRMCQCQRHTSKSWQPDRSHQKRCRKVCHHKSPCYHWVNPRSKSPFSVAMVLLW